MIDPNCQIPDPRWLESYTSDWLREHAETGFIDFPNRGPSLGCEVGTIRIDGPNGISADLPIAPEPEHA